VNLLQLQPEERVTAILKADLTDKTHLFLVTRQGTVKRTELNQFENIRRSGLIAQKVPSGDELRWVVATNGKNEIFLLSHKGKAIRFKEEDARSMGRAAAGVRGIRLSAGDHVVEAAVIDNPGTSKLLVVMENGLGKMTPVTEYRFQGRGGSGVKAAQLTAKTGDVIGGCVLQEGDEGDLLCLSKQGQAIRMKLSDIPSRGRATQGVIIMRLKARDKVASMSVVMEDKESEEAVQEAAAETRTEEVERIKQEERRVKRAARVGAPIAAPVSVAKSVEKSSAVQQQADLRELPSAPKVQKNVVAKKPPVQKITKKTAKKVIAKKPVKKSVAKKPAKKPAAKKPAKKPLKKLPPKKPAKKGVVKKPAKKKPVAKKSAKKAAKKRR
jgi:DNA gyrase/topoisomerase IV subunit A